MKIFLIDDEYINNIIGSKLLSKIDNQLEVVKFTNPEQAYNELKIERPDLIFLDLNMPVMTGWQFLDKMRNEETAYQVVVLTSSVCRSDSAKALAYPNVIGYAEKPLDKQIISEYIKSTISPIVAIAS